MSIDVLHLGRADQGRLVTQADFEHAIFEEPWRYERVQGRLRVMTPSGSQHNRAHEPWRDALVVYKLAHPDVVEWVVSEAWIRVDPETERIADVGVYLAGRRSSAEIPDRVPELAFQFVSPGSRARDDVEKVSDYETADVLEYVVIDR